MTLGTVKLTSLGVMIRTSMRRVIKANIADKSPYSAGDESLITPININASVVTETVNKTK